jgi:alpha-tubulin suppressor-like RCC1 family protein
MATINVSNLVLTMQQKISSSTNEQDLFYYSKVLQQLRSGKVYVVAQASDLPAASSNIGELYYVSSNRTLYYSNQVLGAWVSVTTTNSTPLFGWGGNFCGVLGDNTTLDKLSPVREITSSTNWCQGSSVYSNSSAIKTDGSLWSWGLNRCGELGDTTTTSRSSPVREITSSSNWCQVSVGQSRTVGIKTDGTLWNWGWNFCGALGDNTWINRASPIREISSSTTWCRVSAGISHTAALKTDGSLWAWGGTNSLGQLGNNTSVGRCSPVREITSSTTWCRISAGWIHTTAIKTDGTLWAWGYNRCGRLGDNTVVTRSSPVREITSSTTWCQVAAGNAHTAAVKTDGTLWAWGINFCGPLGDNTTVDKSSPVREITSSTTWCQVSAGYQHAVGIKTDGTLWSWGLNSCGQLGDNTTVTKSSPVREITSLSTWCEARAGNRNTIALPIIG